MAFQGSFLFEVVNIWTRFRKEVQVWFPGWNSIAPDINRQWKERSRFFLRHSIQCLRRSNSVSSKKRKPKQAANPSSNDQHPGTRGTIAFWPTALYTSPRLGVSSSVPPPMLQHAPKYQPTDKPPAMTSSFSQSPHSLQPPSYPKAGSLPPRSLASSHQIAPTRSNNYTGSTPPAPAPSLGPSSRASPTSDGPCPAPVSKQNLASPPRGTRSAPVLHTHPRSTSFG